MCHGRSWISRKSIIIAQGHVHCHRLSFSTGLASPHDPASETYWKAENGGLWLTGMPGFKATLDGNADLGSSVLLADLPGQDIGFRAGRRH